MERSAIRGQPVDVAIPDFAALHPGYGIARIAEFVETDQSDSPCPVPFPKRFPFPLDPNQIYKPRRLVPQRGAYRDRHERGAGCGGRGSVGHAR
jgi:hypothetical protein